MQLVKDRREIRIEVSAYMAYQLRLWIGEKITIAQNIVVNAEDFSKDSKTTGLPSKAYTSKPMHL